MAESVRTGHLLKRSRRAGAWSLVLTVLLAFLCISCDNPYLSSKDKRTRIAQEGKGDVVVAVVWPPSGLIEDRFLKGIDLAVAQINEAGGVLKRRLRVIRFEEQIDSAKPFNTKLVTSNPQVVAVVGHFYARQAIPASIAYEYHGILYLAPSATANALTSHGFRLVFRTLPNDRAYGESLAGYCRKKGYRNILVLDNNTVDGKGLADVFHETATNVGINVVARYSYFEWEDDYRALIDRTNKLQFDAVFLAGALPQAAKIIRQCRQMNLSAPVVAMDALDFPELIDLAGKDAEGVVVPTNYDELSSDPDFLRFKAAFAERFHALPDDAAARGYDTIRLLAHAMNESSTTMPLVVASILRHELKWKGALQEYSFDDSGELDKVDVLFKQVSRGRFVYIKE